MLIDNEFEVAAPVDEVWRYLLDVPRMAPCLPGAQLTEVVDDNTYKGRVTTKLGPVSMSFAGIAKIVERDEAKHRVVLNATAAEETGRSQATMTVTSTLVAAGRATKVTVSQDLQISGAAAQFGRGMIQDVSTVIMRDFASNVAADIGRWSKGEQRAASPRAAGGLGIGFQAVLLALKRFFRRLFGGKDR